MDYSDNELDESCDTITTQDCVVEEYKDGEDKDAVVKHVINTCQTSSFHTRVAIRVKASNYEEMVLSFDYYIEKFNLFTQAEAVVMKNKFFSIIESVPYKNYSILIPIFFIYAYCASEGIAFPKSVKKNIAIEIYTKNNCSVLMEVMVRKFSELLGFKHRANYPWSYYVKSLIMMFRCAAYSAGSASELSVITPGDSMFLNNKLEPNSVLKLIEKKVQVESYRLLALGMIKHNCFNSSEFEQIFDLHIKTLLNIIESKEIAPKSLIDEVSTRFQHCPPNKKLGPHYVLEEEIYANSSTTNIDVLDKYSNVS